MRYLGLLLALFSAISFSGCAYLHTFDANLPEKIERWIKEEKYRTALDTLEHIKPAHEQYERLMQQKRNINAIIEKREKKTIAQASRHAAKNEWHKGNLLYQSTLKKLPPSKNLNQAYQEFLDKRQNYIDNLQTRLMINKGDWLKQNKSLYTRIRLALPADYHSINGMQDYEQDRREALQVLKECALTSASANNLGLARRCLYLAEQLDSSLKNDNQLDPVRRKINAARKDRMQHYKQQIIELLSELQQGNSLDNLQRAQDLLHSSSQYADLNDPVLELLEKLGRRLQNGINQRMESARRLYSQSKIEEALQIWTSLQNIAPDNQQLEAHIERARRVLDKLERLQQENPVITPPVQQD